MNESFLSWVKQRVSELEKEIDRLNGVLELNKEYEATRSTETDNTLFERETPTECIRRMFIAHPGSVLDTDDLCKELHMLRTNGLLETKADPKRSSRSLVHASMNWLVKQGFVTKLPPARKKGPARYKMV